MLELHPIILGNVQGDWQKVAKVLSASILPIRAFFSKDAYEAVLRRLASDNPEFPDNENMELVREIDTAILELLEEGAIESQGNVKKWRLSEIKLMES